MRVKPCPSGYQTGPRRECHCTPRQIRQYLGRISGPLLDPPSPRLRRASRIDIQVEVPAVRYRDLRSPLEGEPSAVIRERLIRAREMQTRRFASQPLRSPEPGRGGEGGYSPSRASGTSAPVFCNARMTGRMVKKFCKVDGPAQMSLASAMQQFSLSARAYNKILKLSRNIADLDGADEIRPEHVAEGIQYRSLDRNLSA